MSLGSNEGYICLPEDGVLTIIATNLTYGEAATIPFGGNTALHFLRKGNTRNEQKVLIYCASGITLLLRETFLEALKSTLLFPPGKCRGIMCFSGCGFCRNKQLRQEHQENVTHHHREPLQLLFQEFSKPFLFSIMFAPMLLFSMTFANGQ